MEQEIREKYDAKAKELRVELKQWESEWAKNHDGYKPGRQDIKENPDIAGKYKEYNKIRDILSGKVPPPSDKPHAKRTKRGSDAAPVETPIKRTKYSDTPSKDAAFNKELMNTPIISRKLFNPAPVSTIGPTPQRDGRVLGLFDLLVEEELGTPSKRQEAAKNAGRGNVHATPSKRKSSLDPESVAKLGRTPMSTSKRQLLNTFMTPLKNRGGADGARTPGSVSKLQFDTPSFLKRHSLPVLEENAEFDAPAPLRLPRKPITRALSEIVASLRKVEEDKLDDDLEALREIENEEMGPSPNTAPPPQGAENNMAKESQTHRPLLGGFDDEGMYDSQEEAVLGRDGNPLRVYKKKGQKRTTRRVNMRPVKVRRPTADGQDAENDGSDEDGDAIPETQAGAAISEAPGLDPDEDFLDSGSDVDNAENKSPIKAVQKPKGIKQKGHTAGAVKKTVRKVNELAHANFQRLKLRNYGAKGGPGQNSRFRRRR